MSPSPDLDTSAPVPLIDVNRQFAPLKEEILAAIAEVCDSGRYVLGPPCEELERRIAEYCGCAEAVGCASGSDALLLALMAFGIGPGDEVLVPSYTFFATASAVWRLGARPVFVDIEPRHYEIDPEQIEAHITSATRAIIPVHLYGQCADMAPILEIASRHKLRVIEDAAQAIGAEYGGQRAGSIGHVGCFSFYPTKNLGGLGDGGMLTTNDSQLADRLRLLRGHGMRPRYYHEEVGLNSRLDSLQAAALNVKLSHLDQYTRERTTNALRYHALLQECGLDQVMELPSQATGRVHVWNQYIVRVPGGRRDHLRAFLAHRQISSEIYYPVPLHQQKCFENLSPGPGNLPETEKAALETVALPIFPELTEAEQQRVVAAIAGFWQAAGSATVKKPNFLSRSPKLPACGE